MQQQLLTVQSSQDLHPPHPSSPLAYTINEYRHRNKENLINTALEHPQVQAMKENNINISIRKALQQYTRKLQQKMVYLHINKHLSAQVKS